MFKSILIPLDGSTFGEHALPHALSIARRTGAKVTLVHVHAPLKAVYMEGAAFIDNDFEEEIKAQQQAYLDIVVERAKAILKENTVTAKHVEGDIASSIATAAANEKADLLVMTTHGRSPLGRFWLGSVTDELVRSLPIPLMLIHPTEITPDLNEEKHMHKILIPLDGSDLGERIVKPATELGKPVNANYTLVRIVKPVLPMNAPMEVSMASESVQGSMEQIDAVQQQLQQQAKTYLDEVSERMRKDGFTVQTIVDIAHQPAVAILEEAEKNAVDLIAMKTHGRRGLSRLFLGSVADKVIRGTKIPILVQRPKE